MHGFFLVFVDLFLSFFNLQYHQYFYIYFLSILFLYVCLLIYKSLLCTYYFIFMFILYLCFLKCKFHMNLCFFFDIFVSSVFLNINISLCSYFLFVFMYTLWVFQFFLYVSLCNSFL